MSRGGAKYGEKTFVALGLMMDFGGDDDAGGWAEVGSHVIGDDVGIGLKFANSGALELDDVEDSGSDEEDYVVKVRFFFGAVGLCIFGFFSHSYNWST